MRIAPIARLVFWLGMAGCSDGASPGGTLRSVRSALNPPGPPPDTIPEMLDYAPDLQVNLSDMAKLPEGVLWIDLVPGDTLSPPAQPGDSVEIGYAGWLPSGVQVDSGSAALRVGAGAVIGGIDLSIAGMRTGGRRKLVVPPGLAYGAEGLGEVPPGSVLVYDLELLRIIR
jgi:hypothetical protein